MKKTIALIVVILCFTGTYSQGTKNITLDDIWAKYRFYPRSKDMQRVSL